MDWYEHDGEEYIQSKKIEDHIKLQMNYLKMVMHINVIALLKK